MGPLEPTDESFLSWLPVMVTREGGVAQNPGSARGIGEEERGGERIGLMAAGSGIPNTMHAA